MPAIRCSACNYRNFHAARFCNNCGAALSSQDGQIDELPVDGEPFDDDPAEAGLPPTGPAQPQERGLVPRKSTTPTRVQTSLVAYRDETELAPYEVDINLREHQGQAFHPMTITEEEGEPEPPAWMTERFPWYFPGSAPKLYGKIIHIQTEMQFPDYPNMFRAFVDIFSEFIWIGTNQPTHREGERIQVTIVRVRTDSGQVKDARLMGYLRGANLSLGDLVSFWGWKRKGSLTVKRGYNHTSKAVVSTNMMSMLWPALIIMVLIGLIFFAAFAWNNISNAWSLLTHIK